MTVQILRGDCRDVLKSLPDESVHCVVTSPPYFGLRDYGMEGQIGLEPTPAEFADQMVSIFREVRRVLRSDGTLWLNLGDSYAGSGKGGNPPDSPHQKQATNAGSIVRGKRIERGAGRWGGGNLPSFEGIKPKDLIGIPWMVAFALRADGWWLRQDIIWQKPNPMPESVTDRPTSCHEHIFLLSKSQKYFFDSDAVREPLSSVTIDRLKYKRTSASKWFGNGSNDTDMRGTSGARANLNGRNIRNVWTIPTSAFPGAHFATFPQKLVEPCIKAGCPVEGTVLDPFGGAGTVGLVASQLNRSAILIELNADYAALATNRINGDSGMFPAIALSK